MFQYQPVAQMTCLQLYHRNARPKNGQVLLVRTNYTAFIRKQYRRVHCYYGYTAISADIVLQISD